jgi:2-polyprenyl-3-methyl-5-hydroxy-6-metoxy-1,4-benzoquinol methylase
MKDTMTHRAKALVRDGIDQTLTRVGLSQSSERITADAQAYWTSGEGRTWASDVHWRSGLTDKDWQDIGTEHWSIWQTFARAVDANGSLKRIVDWGCGGGANAVAFAPHCAEYIGVDIVPANVQECENQVAMRCDTPFRGVTIDATQPEIGARDIPKCDLFLCLYVFEALPTPEYGLRVLKIAADLLEPTGHAFIQIKYRTGWRTASRRRSYRSSTLPTMTSYRIEEFWNAAMRCGLRPQLIHLVPRNALDERYAYFLLSAPLS